jgi:hypothetical protein
MAAKIRVFQDMTKKYSKLGNWRASQMAICVACFYHVDSEKALINEDDRPGCKLRVYLYRLVVETHLGRFWNVFPP